MKACLFALFMLLAPAAQAQGIAAFPYPADLSHNIQGVRDIAALSYEAFADKHFAALVYTADTLNPRRPVPTPTILAAGVAELKADATFAALAAEYLGLVGAYAQILPTYQPAFDARNAHPEDKERAAHWAGVSAACNLLVKGLEEKAAEMQARVKALRP